MDLSKIPLFEMLTRRMSWLSQRQEVLAQNIANSDTPNFTARDLPPLDFRGALHAAGPLPPLRTDVAHLGGAGRPQAFRGVAARSRYETTPSGNGVVLEEQLMKVAETQADYQLVTSLYRKHVDMIKVALGRGQG